MMHNQAQQLLAQYCQTITPNDLKKYPMIAFQNHPQFPMILDILSRKKTKAVTLEADFFTNFSVPFLEALSLHLAQSNLHYALCDVELISLDLPAHFFELESAETLKLQIQKRIDETPHLQIWIMPAIDETLSKPETLFLHSLQKLIQNHPCAKLMILSTTQTKHTTRLAIQPITNKMIVSILKREATELEAHHHVSISDEVLWQAYELSQRYLSANDALSRAIELLDSSAARARTNDATPAALTKAMLLKVLSTWTVIPTNLLSLEKLSFNLVYQQLQNHLFGQEAGAHIISHALQQSSSYLQEHRGPRCGFLFTGPRHTGKKTAALALGEVLFHQKSAVYFSLPTSQQAETLLGLRFCAHQQHRAVTLSNILETTPYAIIFIQDIDQIHPKIWHELHEVLNTGFLHDDNGKTHHFNQAIFIFSTLLGSDKLITCTKGASPLQEAAPLNLMQLLMHETAPPAPETTLQYAPHELTQEVLPAITTVLPATLCQLLDIVPFIPLNVNAIEKILREKLNILALKLKKYDDVELRFTPDVLRYFVNEALVAQHTQRSIVNIDTIIQPLFTTIEQALQMPSSIRNDAKQLFLQLNETGQLLRCDWITTTTSQYAT